MDGVLVVDKPPGMTSHDVVAVARRALGESRMGHTGTLDPAATGVLPLVCGRATRLVRFFISSDKDYEAGIRFGLSTDTYDISGNELTRSELVPTLEAVETALAPLRGTYLQSPPAYSAKKVAGRRAYALARRKEDVTLAPVRVSVTRATLLELSGPVARVGITCSGGFYVRTFAHVLGEGVGTGACLESLRRTRSGEFGLDQAVNLERLQAGTAAVAERWIPLEALLPGLPAVRLSAEGRRRVAHGQEVDTSHRSMDVEQPWPRLQPAAATSVRGVPGNWVRLLDAEGRLLAMGTAGSTAGALHPAVVLT